MNKKKLLVVAMTLAMVAVLAIGGTIAYFTDTENETNVFTVGYLDIVLNEDERKIDEETEEFTNELQKFSDKKLLLPIVGSAQTDDKTEVNSDAVYEVEAQWPVPNTPNWVDKIVSVTNEGTEDAYVRTLFAFPADMDDAVNASNMMLHWNSCGEEPDGFWLREDKSIQIELEGKKYNIYCNTYLPVLENDTTTAWPSITGVYIDSRVNAVVNNDGSITYSLVDEKEDLNKYATFAKGEGPKIFVLTQAVQSEGFAATETQTAAEVALEAGFPNMAANVQDWFNALLPQE